MPERNAIKLTGIDKMWTCIPPSLIPELCTKMPIMLLRAFRNRVTALSEIFPEKVDSITPVSLHACSPCINFYAQDLL